jgi:hypothetical protein
MKKKQSDKWSNIIASVFTKPEDDMYSHEYDINFDQETGRTTIIHSHSGTWSEDCKGEQAGHIVDDEDNITIYIDGQVLILDYSEFEALTALVMAVNQDEIELRQYKTINKLTKTRKND